MKNTLVTLNILEKMLLCLEHINKMCFVNTAFVTDILNFSGIFGLVTCRIKSIR